ncbi:MULTISPECIES: protein-ADP-ribose hydrolase [unclassified Actinomyces]|uniref:protein-ADP-ribose hydrolase n=1 Tax=unclassified Actinomyces TaxID=2609248 RepID=UPI002017C10E|nr:MULTISPECIES: protein-ADP-ribose hydrolase [unclassified Actinomyces]MCL3778175.1 protein-ADP-ribose hydrolase [Actinomyces sp. AC-20-1]MCL3790037.1 protein-ADP-ribose hydrolase [Actinomyces sp. 187325]MCL3792726.1 protein-ADP-ribose hydrolase [Actinomyces sp. 186855]MCL3793603.1 protein-ADP-ribose hydrolase [Actinomyces sp. 217892]
MTADRRTTLLTELVRALCLERGTEPPAATSADDLWTVFRALVNTRPPAPADVERLAMQDELLRSMIEEAGTATLADAQASPHDDRLLLWRGDITTLAVDAVVNAANSQMLGCWAPGHHCIDNAIHTFAGTQLRLECARLMRAQGHEEPTGTAKITSAYNLPSRHVIHTVGPIANGHPTDLHRRQLASCYTSCLDLAAAKGLRSIAFCGISTGVFGFPQDEAAPIAVETVRTWLGAHETGIRVVFNVFSADDERVYRGLLGL